MHRPVTFAVALTLLLPAAGVVAASPARSGAPATASPGDAALAAVRALDGRFAELPTREEQQRLMARDFDWAHVLAASWIGVLPTLGATLDGAPEMPAWVDPGLGRLVEVVLVAGCPESLTELPATDPCEWRHTYAYLVGPDGVPVLVAEAGDPMDVS